MAGIQPGLTKTMAGRVRTYTGKMIDPLNLRPEDIDIVDIAHALGRQCRYNGMCDGHYSTAEHSILVAELVGIYGDDEIRKAALMHDAAEAYLGDVSTFLKQSPEMAPYRQLEDRVEQLIEDVFGVKFESGYEWNAIKAADILVYSLEKKVLFKGPLNDDDVHPKFEWALSYFPESIPFPKSVVVNRLPGFAATSQFMNMFERLTRKLAA